MNNQNLGWIIAGILLLILIVGAFYYYNNLTNLKSYQNGFSDGQIQVIQDIGNTKLIPYFATENNQTQIKYASIQSICSGG